MNNSYKDMCNNYTAKWKKGMEEPVDYKETVEDVDGYIKRRKRYYFNGQELDPMLERDKIMKLSDLKQDQQRRLKRIEYCTIADSCTDWLIKNIPLKKVIDELREHYNYDSPEDWRFINRMSIDSSRIKCFNRYKDEDPHMKFYEEIGLYPERFKEITHKQRIEGLFNFGLYYGLFHYRKNIGAELYSVPKIVGTITQDSIYNPVETMSKIECKKIFNHLSQYYNFIGTRFSTYNTSLSVLFSDATSTCLLDEVDPFTDALLAARNEDGSYMGSYSLLMNALRTEMVYVTDDEKYLKYMKKNKISREWNGRTLMNNGGKKW